MRPQSKGHVFARKKSVIARPASERRRMSIELRRAPLAGTPHELHARRRDSSRVERVVIEEASDTQLKRDVEEQLRSDSRPHRHRKSRSQLERTVRERADDGVPDAGDRRVL